MFELGSSLQAFVADLVKSGDGDRVVVMVFSEFGRRLTENASAGTDHGTAAPLFLAGTIVLLLGVMTVIGTLISDIVLVWVDPRIRIEDS